MWSYWGMLVFSNRLLCDFCSTVPVAVTGCRPRQPPLRCCTNTEAVSSAGSVRNEVENQKRQG